MEIIAVVGIVLVLIFAAGLIFAVRAGQASARADKHAYAMRVLHAVETRGEFDRQERMR